MTLRVCLDCTTAFAVGAPRCPHCGSERHAEEGSAAALGIHHGIPVETEEDRMPKITRHGGASVAGEEPATEGGEQPSAEATPEAPVEEQAPAPRKATAGRRKAARTTPEQDTE